VVPPRRAEGRFIVGAALAVFLETSLAGAECIGPTLPGPELLDLQLCFPARHSLGIARARVEDHFPEPERFGRIAALFGKDGQVAAGEVAVDALVDATELVGTLERQDPPPAGLGRLAGRCPRERRVARRGQVVDPHEIEHPGPELARDFAVRSVLPVSTTTISSNSPAMEERQ